MNKSIFAGLVILAVAGCGSIAAPAASTAARTAATPASSTAATPSATPACVVSLNAPQCHSTAPDLTVDWVSAGGTSGCSFTWSINWGDGSAAQQVTVDGQQEAGEYFLADHTYQATQPRTYSITASDVSVTGGCTISPGSYTFTKATTAPAPSLSVDAGANQTILGTNIISLDGQVTGDAADVAWTQVSGPGTTNFASSKSAATTATVSTPGTYVFELTAEGDGTSASGQVTVKVQAYVALGDSYSAGDGAGAYLADSADPRCLQSAYAYPELVDAKVAGANAIPAGTANPAFVFAACTGAEVPDFNSLQSDNQPAQLSYLKNLPANSVGLVTLTVGGNDAGFGQVMGYCATQEGKESCQEHSQAEVNRIILNQLPLKLFDLYRQIKSEPSLAPDAQILVLGYPQFFPTSQATSCPTGFVTGALGYEFRPSDMAWIDSVIKLVDSDIQASASAAGLTYVDTSNAFAGNQLCQPDPDLNSAVIGPGLYFEGYPVGVQSFHPNAAGQSVLAQNVSPAVPFPTS
jgi:lysophospholipase L1-like esterase